MQILPKQHASRFVKIVEEARTHIQEITPQQLKEKLDKKQPIHLIDVREESEYSTGSMPTAVHLSKGIIERDIEKRIADPEAEIVVYCSGGFRSVLVAETLQKMGYIRVYSVQGGLRAWLEAGLPLERK